MSSSNAKIILLVCIVQVLSISFNISLAQEPSATNKNFLTNRSKNCLKSLSNGILFVRLSSQSKKIQILESAINNSQISSKDKLKNSKRLKSVLESRNRFHSAFIRSMKQYYKFSKVYFYYDYEQKKLNSSDIRQIRFLDENLNPTVLLDTLPTFYMILKQDKTRESGLEAFIFVDQEQSKMFKPFPDQFRIYPLNSMLTGLYHEPAATMKRCDHIVKNIQKKLSLAFQSVNTN